MYKNIKYFAVLSIILTIDSYNQRTFRNERLFYHDKIIECFYLDRLVML